MKNIKKIGIILIIAIIALAVLIYIFSLLYYKKPVPPEINIYPKLWGIYAGTEPNALENFENLIGKKTNIEAVFISWGNENQFPKTADSFFENKTLLIYWEAQDYDNNSAEQTKFSFKSILNGNWDAYIKSFAEQAKNYSYPIILIPFPEMNINEYPWSGAANGNNPDEFIMAYKYIRGFFSSATNVKFGWAVNNDSVPDTAENAITNYYPGSAYVDYVGVDGFNFGNPWQTYDQVFSSALNTLSQYGKPIYIFSMASAAGSQKPAWISDALSKIYSNPKIAGFIWFNENKEQNWLINSDSASLKAFQEGVR